MNIKTAFALASIAMLSAVGSAWAGADADATILYRKAVMQTMGSHLKAMSAIVKGGVPLSDDLPPHSDGLTAATAISLKTFQAKVLEGQQEKTTVKPEIWTGFDRFSDAMRKTEQDTEALQAAVATGDRAAIAARMAEVGKDCKACHDDTRNK